MIRLKAVIIFVIVLVFFVLSTSCTSSDDTGSAQYRTFKKTYIENALPIEQLPEIRKDHPRLLIRSESWKGGLSLKEFRQARKIKKPSYKLSQPHHGTQFALYYLQSGDESVIPGIINVMKNTKWGGYMIWLAYTYDWIYNSPNFSEEDKRIIGGKIAEWLQKFPESYGANDMWHHRAYPAVCSPLIASLALDERDFPEVQKWRRSAMGYIKKNFLPGWQITEGGWQGGGHAYFRRNQVYLLIEALACWQSATDEDIFGIIKKDYGDFLQKHMNFMITQNLPDNTRVESTGFDYAPHITVSPLKNIMLISRAYKNPNGYYYLRKWFDYEPKNDPFLYDSGTDKLLPKHMPLTQIWGPEGLGYVQMRSGWGKDDTVIEFKSGDYFWSHNMLNQGSFYIYRKGRLAVQSGLYDQWGSDHFSHYYSKSISSNTILVFQPGEFTWTPDQRTKDKDKNGFLKEHGGQREVRWGAENNFTFEKYLWSLKPAPKGETSYGRALETGNITAFETGPDYRYSYVAGDFTDAYSNTKYAYEKDGRYNKPKVDQVNRALVYLDKRFLIVFDRVNTIDPGYRKVWLCHFQGEPHVDGNIINQVKPGHIEDYNGRNTSVIWADGVNPPPNPRDPGKLLIRTLMPEQHYIRKIGGKGYEFWDGEKNRPPVKSDYGRQDTGNWRIEVSPAVPAKFHNFLHVLYPCDKEVDRIPPTTVIKTNTDNAAGVMIENWVAVFGRKGTLSNPLGYSVPSGENFHHIIADLQKNRKYRVVTGSVTREMKSSDQGILYFKGDGEIRIIPG